MSFRSWDAALGATTIEFPAAGGQDGGTAVTHCEFLGDHEGRFTTHPPPFKSSEIGGDHLASYSAEGSG